jgi:hypothetical protein
MDDARALLAPLPEVPAADNGRLAMVKLPASIRRPESKGKVLVTYPNDRPESEKMPGVNEALLAEYQQDNAELIAAFRRLLQMPSWQRVRAEEKVTDFMGPGSYDARLMLPANVVLAEAMVRALSGQPEQAWPDILAVMQLGRRMVLSRGTMNDVLAGRTLVDRAVDTAAWAGQYAPDAATARRMAAALQPLEDCTDFYLPAMEGWFYYHLKETEVIQAGGDTVKKMVVTTYANLEATSQDLNELARDLVNGKEPANSPVANPAPADRPEVLDEKVSLYMKDPPRQVTKLLEQLANSYSDERLLANTEAFRRARQLKVTTLADYRKKHSLSDKETGADKTARVYYGIAIHSTAHARMARVSLLLRAWKHDHEGGLPQTLEALVPDYLSALPVDPFDGKPLRYNTKALWCTGPDLTDDGGSLENGKDLGQKL